MICAYCGGDHSWFYCRTKPEGWKPPKKSTAARKDVPDSDRMLQRQMSGTLNPASPSLVAASIEHSEPAKPRVANRAKPAGTQAPPVDTKRGRGRPKTITDMRAYKAQKAKDYRKAKRKDG